jgi:hypothetical protein
MSKRKALIILGLLGGAFLLYSFFYTSHPLSSLITPPPSASDQKDATTAADPSASATPAPSADNGNGLVSPDASKNEKGERIKVTPEIAAMTHEQLKHKLMQKFDRRFMALEANFEGVYGRATINDPNWKGDDPRELATRLLRENPELLAGLPAQTEVYVHDVRRSKMGTSVIFSGDYHGFLYPGVKIVEFDNDPMKDGPVSGLQGIKDSTILLHKIDECTGRPASQEDVKQSLRRYHQNEITAFTNFSKQIFPDGGRTGTKIYAVSYKVRTTVDEIYSYSAAVEYCSGEVRTTHKTDLQ